LVDLVSLAQDRRWESIDTIRAVKSVLGTGLLGAGAYELGTSHSNTDTEIGLGLLAAGLVLKATSQGDVRVWEMLPRSTFVIPLQIPPGTHDITVEFSGTGHLRQTWHSLPIPLKRRCLFTFACSLRKRAIHLAVAKHDRLANPAGQVADSR